MASTGQRRAKRARSEWGDLGVPQCSHSTLRHVGRGRVEKAKRIAVIATRLRPLYTGISFQKSANLDRFGMPV